MATKKTTKTPALRTRIDSLTDAERARMPEWRDKWIAIGLSTERADCAKFEAAIPACYEAAKLPPPKRIVWVTSPMMLAVCAPLAALEIEKRKRGIVDAGAVRDAVRGAVGGAVDSAVRGAVGGAVRDAVDGVVGGAVDSAVRDAVDGASASISEYIRSLDAHQRDVIRRGWYSQMRGQFDVGYWWWGSPAFVSFFRDVCGLALSDDIAKRAAAYQATCESACWWWPHRDFVMVSERPTRIARDAQGRLHHESGQAIEWSDGWGLYRWHGIDVPADVITHPEHITVERIHAERNEELRRVMIERYGLTRYARDAQFEIVDQDVDPLGQPRRLLKRDDVVVVELTNSTEDADGTRRVYHVACDPQLRPMLPTGDMGDPQPMTCLAAVASTYGMRASEYVPEVET